MAQTLKLGNLYLDDKPITSGVKYRSGQVISFGEATSDEPLGWVPVNGLLIADQCLLTCISWNDLDAQGLVFGKEIELCGFRFRARLLKAGDNEGIPDEWDAALDIVGNSDKLWNWNEMYFWEQETNGFSSYRVIRGYFSACFFFWNSASYHDPNYGFRPVLEPLSADPSTLSPGQEVLVIGYDGCVAGYMMEKTQYDLILRPKADGLVGESTFVAIRGDGSVVVDRDNILSITAAWI